MPKVHVARHWDGRKPGDEFNYDGSDLDVLVREGVLRRVADDKKSARKSGPTPEPQTYPGPVPGTSSEGK